jgi:hypothetical protein
MNYRRKKISMKERLEAAIEEIGDELLQGSGFERERRKKGSARSNLVVPSFASRTLKPTVGTQYRHIRDPPGPEPTSATSAKSRLVPGLVAAIPRADVQGRVGGRTRTEHDRGP